MTIDIRTARITKQLRTRRHVHTPVKPVSLYVCHVIRLGVLVIIENVSVHPFRTEEEHIAAGDSNQLTNKRYNRRSVHTYRP